MPTPHAIYSKPATVYLESASDKLTAMQQAIDNSGFLQNVEDVWSASGKSRADFLIAVKPNIMTGSIREDPSPVYTDPGLVEYLFDQLRAAGFSRFAVVEARNVYDYSYQGRSVKAVAEMEGYSGSGYTIEDLTEQMEPHDYGGVLGLHHVGRTWRDADYRVSFAKNKTHWQCFYTGCLKNVYGCLPMWDKMKHYHRNPREFYQCTILILNAFPVHFGFLDAWVSGDGLTGHVRDADPNLTHTIFASENVMALDWVMGLKMGVDPRRNSVIREALDLWGPVEAKPSGDMTPWVPWRNVRPITVKVFDILEEFYWTSYVLSRTFASRQDPRFPPVSRWQWLFGALQKVAGALEGIAVKMNKL